VLAGATGAGANGHDKAYICLIFAGSSLRFAKVSGNFPCSFFADIIL